MMLTIRATRRWPRFRAGPPITMLDSSSCHGVGWIGCAIGGAPELDVESVGRLASPRKMTNSIPTSPDPRSIMFRAIVFLKKAASPSPSSPPIRTIWGVSGKNPKGATQQVARGGLDTPSDTYHACLPS